MCPEDLIPWQCGFQAERLGCWWMRQRSVIRKEAVGENLLSSLGVCFSIFEVLLPQPPRSCILWIWVLFSLSTPAHARDLIWGLWHARKMLHH